MMACDQIQTHSLLAECECLKLVLDPLHVEDPALYSQLFAPVDLIR
jgi:hypothetical protein